MKETFRLAEFYSSADVFLNLSIEETFGKVSAEALSCGTPIVTVDSTANSELAPEFCGYVCSNLDLNSILKNLSKIYKNGKGFYSSLVEKLKKMEVSALIFCIFFKPKSCKTYHEANKIIHFHLLGLS